MSVFDRTKFGRGLQEFEPFWWAGKWTGEEKRIAGDPANRISHMRRTKQRIDADAARHPDNCFGPKIAP